MIACCGCALSVLVAVWVVVVAAVHLWGSVVGVVLVAAKMSMLWVVVCAWLWLYRNDLGWWCYYSVCACSVGGVPFLFT